MSCALSHPRHRYRRWPKPPEECAADPFVFRFVFRPRHVRCGIARVLNSPKAHRDEFDNGCCKGASKQKEKRGTASCKQSPGWRTPRDVDHDSGSGWRRSRGGRRICHISFVRARLGGHRYARHGLGGTHAREQASTRSPARSRRAFARRMRARSCKIQLPVP
jgi:hypothetical protein